MQIKKTKALIKLRELTQRTRVIKGGTSASKTFCILLILINDAITNKGKEISVVAESIPSIKRGALKDFLSIMQGLNRFREVQFNRSTLKYTFNNGSYIEFLVQINLKGSGELEELISLLMSVTIFLFLVTVNYLSEHLE